MDFFKANNLSCSIFNNNILTVEKLQKINGIDGLYIKYKNGTEKIYGSYKLITDNKGNKKTLDEITDKITFNTLDVKIENLQLNDIVVVENELYKIDNIIEFGKKIYEFFVVENGKELRYATDEIDDEYKNNGWELFCPHSKIEYEIARQYLVSIGKPTAMGPLGIYYTEDGPGCCDWEMKNYPLNSDGLGSKGWKVKDGSLTWWAADTTSDPTFDRQPMAEPNGDYTAYAYLGIWYDDNGYIKHYNDKWNDYSYTTYLLIKRKPIKKIIL